MCSATLSVYGFSACKKRKARIFFVTLQEIHVKPHKAKHTHNCKHRGTSKYTQLCYLLVLAFGLLFAVVVCIDKGPVCLPFWSRIRWLDGTLRCLKVFRHRSVIRLLIQIIQNIKSAEFDSFPVFALDVCVCVCFWQRVKEREIIVLLISRIVFLCVVFGMIVWCGVRIGLKTKNIL